MAEDADLFVVCRSCGAEVSRYVTECPYCGSRVQKRAPKIPAGGSPPQAPRQRRRPLRVPGLEGSLRPVVSTVLAALCAVGTVILVPGALSPGDAGVVGPVDGQWWRVAVAPFLAPNVWYGALGVLGVACFGTLVERRDGPLVVAVVFVACGMGGVAAAAALETVPFALGANGAVLGLIGAWALPEARAVGSGGREWPELLPAGICAAVMLLVPLAAPEASPTAGLVGLALGLAIGATLGRR
ncbi:MAG: rhomboid family intramembrane serine protease [Solirubrobacterales bacterium]